MVNIILNSLRTLQRARVQFRETSQKGSLFLINQHHVCQTLTEWSSASNGVISNKEYRPKFYLSFTVRWNIDLLALRCEKVPTLQPFVSERL